MATPSSLRAARAVRATSLALPLLAALVGCDRSAPEPAQQKPAATPAPPPVVAKPSVPSVGGDPKGGKFALEDAAAGLEGAGSKLFADMETTEGTLTCELFADKAPVTVANFVGLARGTRPWNKGGTWVTEPLYDGTPFHRIIKGFMLQGGDPLGSGQGGPGYVIPDEVWPGARHDRRGQLCMANRGPNTNGSQFFITDGAPAHLDGGYTIFGQCGPDEVVQKLAATPSAPGSDRPVKAPVLKKVTIRKG